MSKYRFQTGSKDETGSIPLHVKTDQGEFVALHPAFGPDKPRRLWELIRKENLVEPTAFQAISLINALYSLPNLEGMELKEYLCRREVEDLWGSGRHEEGDTPFGIQTFTALLSDPHQRRLTFFDYPTCWTKDGLDVQDIARRAVEQSQKTRILTFREACAHKGQELTPREIEKSPLMIAICGGKEGAAYAAEITNKNPNQRAYIHPPRSVGATHPEVTLFKIYIDGENMFRFNTGSPVCSMGYSFGLKSSVK